MNLTSGSLCSGYRALDLAVEAVLGTETRWVSDNDAAASRLLKHHWPDTPNLGDLTLIDWDSIEPVDVLTAGYPCQPFSHAGKRKGADDERHLWPYISNAIGALRPGLVILENVAGHLSLGGPTVIADLASRGYDARWVVVRASDVGACHRRARIFIAARDTKSDTRRFDLGKRQTSPDASSQRHGRRQDPRGLGHLDREDADSDGQRERSRQIPSDRSGTAPADADGPERRPHADRGRGTSEGHDGQRQTPSRSGPSSPLPANPQSPRREGPQRREPQRGEPGHRTLPTPRTSDSKGPGEHGDGGGDLRTAIAALTDTNSDGLQGGPQRDGEQEEQAAHHIVRLDAQRRVLWGDYEPAIRRHTDAWGYPPPQPKDDLGRLNPAFVEWMMMVQPGHVTAVPGLSRTKQLHLLGNGVVAPQAAAAIAYLLDDTHWPATA